MTTTSRTSRASFRGIDLLSGIFFGNNKGFSEYPKFHTWSKFWRKFSSYSKIFPMSYSKIFPMRPRATSCLSAAKKPCGHSMELVANREEGPGAVCRLSGAVLAAEDEGWFQNLYGGVGPGRKEEVGPSRRSSVCGRASSVVPLVLCVTPRGDVYTLFTPHVVCCFSSPLLVHSPSTLHSTSLVLLQVVVWWHMCFSWYVFYRDFSFCSNVGKDV
jgi:hypothetical protein